MHDFIWIYFTINFLGRKVTWIRTALGLLCICGVVLVIQPEFIFKGHTDETNSTILEADYHNNTMPTNQVTYSALLVAIGYTSPVATGFLVSANLVLIKRRPFLSDNTTTVLFWSLLLSYCTIWNYHGYI